MNWEDNCLRQNWETTAPEGQKGSQHQILKSKLCRTSKSEWVTEQESENRNLNVQEWLSWKNCKPNSTLGPQNTKKNRILGPQESNSGSQTCCILGPPEYVQILEAKLWPECHRIQFFWPPGNSGGGGPWRPWRPRRPAGAQRTIPPSPVARP